MSRSVQQRVLVALLLVGFVCVMFSGSALRRDRGRQAAPNDGRVGGGYNATRAEVAKVRVGDRMLTNASWTAVEHALACWTSRGRWVKDIRGLDPQGLPRMYRLGLTPNPEMFNKPHSACGTPRQRTGLDFIWQPLPAVGSGKSCESSPSWRTEWSAELMCEVLRGRPVIFCGDGIQTSVYDTLATVLGAAGGGGCQQFGKGCKSEACGGRVKLEHIEVVHCLSSQVLPALQRSPNAIFVTNRGHHFRNTAEVTKDIDEQLSLFSRHAPNVTWIWRNHNMYHGGDAATAVFKGPVDSWRGGFPQLAGKPEWRWGDFPLQGAAVRSMVAAHTGALFLDMLPALMLRPDQHVPGDGLYYCIPGPFDLFPILLLNTLLLVERLASA